jgi:hypothetical protein
MPHVVSQKYGVAEHLGTLKQPFPACQPEMAIEDMQHCLVRDLNIYAQAESGFAPGVVSQIVFASMHKRKGAENGDPPLSSITKAGPAEILIHAEHVGKHTRLIMPGGPRHASINFL